MAASAPPRPGARGFPVKTVRHHRQGIGYHVQHDDLAAALAERELWLCAVVRDELRRTLARDLRPEPVAPPALAVSVFRPMRTPTSPGHQPAHALAGPLTGTCLTCGARRPLRAGCCRSCEVTGRNLLRVA